MWNQNIIINFAQNHRLMIMSNNNDYVRNLTDYITDISLPSLKGVKNIGIGGNYSCMKGN